MADDENIILTDDEPTIIDITQYPTMFGDTSVPFFPEVEVSPKNIENVHQSESGKDVVQTIRKDKLSESVKIKVADDAWVRFFYDLYINADSVAFKQYSPLLQGYDTRTVRITNFSYKMVKHSEILSSVAGVWEMSFNIEEF